ncbi:hypothetical protein [Streptomyces orinoci]|uniref:hypothetical protein n=1 Tax=Streptomyces orinoci TaxID=67339 RepID=UPI00137B274E|nr:hypothetical protein [Streptomyces orinoci]
MLTPRPPVPHTGGPPAYPAKETCPVCNQFRSAVNGAMGRAEWAGVQHFEEQRRTAEEQAAKHREAWGRQP